MKNAPCVKLGIVAVSRDCFPAILSKTRRQAVVEAYRATGADIYECPVIVENSNDTLKALADVNANGVNALVVFLGNFGPEGPETMLAQKFCGPVMFAAAAEESSAEGLVGNRGDAYCGMLNASYNLALRGVRAYIPEYPVGTAQQLAPKIADFATIARVLNGVRKLKIISFGPRPFDFLACNAPIKNLFDLGVEIQENSELDLLEAYQHHAGDPRIASVKAEMEAELGAHNDFPTVLDKLAQYEITLLDWYEKNREACEFAVFANKCWPAFQTMFGFVPCYVNSRLCAQGIPVACETDIYGALTEYILYLVTGEPVTLLDINNTVPADMYAANKAAVGAYRNDEMFMGFHCGNTPICRLKKDRHALRYQYIMKRNLEPDSEPNISRGTLEGPLADGDVTLFRLQSTADSKLRSYIAEGSVLDVDPKSFGGIGVIAVPEMNRFYRHVLIEKNFPHHSGVGFAHCGRLLFEVLKMLGVEDISYNQPASVRYPGENPFAK